jgi:hypothetical protein
LNRPKGRGIKPPEIKDGQIQFNVLGGWATAAESFYFPDNDTLILEGGQWGGGDGDSIRYERIE